MSKTPDLVEPIIGRRMWRVDQHGRLYGLTNMYQWPFAPDMAYDDRVQLNNPYGFYAMKPPRSEHAGERRRDEERVQTERDFEELRGAPWTYWIGDGEVALWGRVARHAHGYRAEYARPMWIRGRFPGHVALKIRNNYQIPAFSIPTTDQLGSRLRAWGILVMMWLMIMVTWWGVYWLATGVLNLFHWLKEAL